MDSFCFFIRPKYFLYMFYFIWVIEFSEVFALYLQINSDDNSQQRCFLLPNCVHNLWLDQIKFNWEAKLLLLKFLSHLQIITHHFFFFQMWYFYVIFKLLFFIIMKLTRAVIHPAWDSYHLFLSRRSFLNLSSDLIYTNGSLAKMCD